MLTNMMYFWNVVKERNFEGNLKGTSPLSSIKGVSSKTLDGYNRK